MLATQADTRLRGFLIGADFPLSAGELLSQARQHRVERHWQRLMALLNPGLTLYSAREAQAEIEALDILESQQHEVADDPIEFEED